MSRLLADTMRETLAGWKNDLPLEWSRIVDVELGFGDISPELTLEPWEPVFPTRRGKSLLGAPDGAHMLAGFEGVNPSAVRCVLIGQDPYPGVAQASGVGFEFGSLPSWGALDAEFAHPLSRLLARTLFQLVAAYRLRAPALARSEADWPRALDSASTLPLPPALTRHWKSEGVLMTNTALTLTRFSIHIDPHYSHGHAPLWKPLLQEVLGFLSSSPQPVVIVAFGNLAQNTVESIVTDSAVRTVYLPRPHPAEGDVLLRTGNVLADCNDALEELGAPPIDW